MSCRYTPYRPSSNGPESLVFWFGASSQVHPCKLDQTNADAHFAHTRKLAVCDGVGTINADGLVPWHLSTAIAIDIDNELQYRLSQNAQKYDRATQLLLMSSVPRKAPGGWLRNLIAKCLSQTTALGSTVYAACHLTNKKLDFCTLGDCRIFVYRGCGQEGAREIFHSTNWWSVNGVRAQAYVYVSNFADLSFEYVEHTFKSCTYGKVPEPVQYGDTVVVVSNGVADNIGSALSYVSKAYTQRMTPEQLYDEIVTSAIANAYGPNGRPEAGYIVNQICNDC